MKIEQLLVQHFYNCRQVTLQGMGTFTLPPDFVMPKDNDKDADIPDNTISFQYNAKATEDEALIDFIVQQTRKMRSLAAADLDSYLALGKQFLNIGKPFKIEGLGMLVKSQSGDLEFTKGIFFNSKMETFPVALREKAENTEISFASETKPTAGNKKGIIIAALIVGFGLIAIAAWYFLMRKNDVEISTVATVVNSDTAKAVKNASDTISVTGRKTVPVNDGYNFKIVFLVTADSAAAVSRMTSLTARYHKIIMYKQDPFGYKLAEPFTLPLSDTTRIKDSLNKFYYAGKGVIELQ